MYCSSHVTSVTATSLFCAYVARRLVEVMSAEENSVEANSGQGHKSTQWSEVSQAINDIKEGMAELNRRQKCLETEFSQARFNTSASYGVHSDVGSAHAWSGETVTQQQHRNLGPLTSPAVGDASTEYVSVRNKHSTVKLPQELTLPDSGKTGIKRTDQPMMNVISKSAKHIETAFKVLKSADDTNTGQTFEDLFTVLYALMQFLQEEQASLVVNSTFDPTVGRFFRALQRGGSFTPAAIDNLRSAASIAAMYRPSASSTQRGRGRGSSFFNQRGRGDIFHNASSRQFHGRSQRDNNTEANTHTTQQ